MGSAHASRQRNSLFLRAQALKGAVGGMECLEPRRLLAQIVVDTAVDESIAANATTSLREAIAQASLLAADDQITFDPEVFDPSTSHTITLTDGAISVPADGGEITIDGIGRDKLTIHGGGSERIFEIADGGDLVINDLTIAGGRATDGDGGAITSDGALVLRNVTLTSNLAEGADGSGMTPFGTSVRGGAIYNAGELTIENGLFTDNSAVGGDGGAGFGGGGSGGNGSGGAIASLNGTLNLRDTEFHGNFAAGGTGGSGDGDGGEGGWALGGAIYIDGGILAIEDGVFAHSGAFAGHGGAVFAAFPSAIGGKGGQAIGGAIYSDTFDATVTNTDFDNSDATAGNGGSGPAGSGDGGDARGGAIYAQGNLVIRGGTIEESAASGGDSLSGVGGQAIGGAIYTVGTLAIADEAAITGNNATGGDGDIGFAGNASGGAIANFGTAIDVTLATLTGNVAQGGAGLLGGVGEGGAIFTTDGGEITITETTIAENSARAGVSNSDTGTDGPDGSDARGGGILIQSGTVTIRRSTVSGNLALASNGDASANGGNGGNASGGGILNLGLLELLNSTVYGNTATAGDGGAAVTGGGNGGGASGGGIYNGLTFSAINATIASNSVNRGSGGFGDVSTGTEGEGSGGGAFNIADAVLTNTLVADNTTNDSNPSLGGLPWTLIHCLITTDEDGLGTAPTPASHDNLFDIDANLGPLQDNGGPTHTAAPQWGSLAIDNGDDAAAEAEFGADGNDQRGFLRIVNGVDIGAVELQEQQIEVKGNGNVIANHDTTPSNTDHTNFGSVAQGASGPTRTYTVTNIGERPLELFAPVVPSGYTVTEALDLELDPGQSDTFTVRLTAAAPGTFAGNVVIASNDPDDDPFTFRITGTVTPVPTPAGTIKINFQPVGRPVPGGYVADVGLVFGNRGNGFSYGWDENISIATRDRELNADQRLDTLVHTQMFGTRTWEIGVPNGAYTVKLVAGDPKYFDSVYKINVEGVLTVNGTPTSGNRFITGTKTVTVSDGKLTVTKATGAVNNKYAYIEITPVTAPVKINFQPSGRPVPSGFLADTGAAFGNRGNGQSYGWNGNAASFTRDRGINSDQKLDTLIHMQLYGVRTWDLAVANGSYQVTLVAGDPQYVDSVYKINVEGQLTVNGTPTSGNRFITGVKTVTVSDGKLTISNAGGSVNNKLAFVEVVKV